jgi:hypothetical protein
MRAEAPKLPKATIFLGAEGPKENSRVSEGTKAIGCFGPEGCNSTLIKSLDERMRSGGLIRRR